MSVLKSVLVLATGLAVTTATHAYAQTTSEAGKAGTTAKAPPKTGAMMKAAPHASQPTAGTNKNTASGGNPGGRTDRN